MPEHRELSPEDGEIVEQYAHASGDAAIVRVADFGSVRSAYQAVREGGTVLIQPGVYRERLSLLKSVTLHGEGPRNEVVLLHADGDCLTVTGGTHTVRGVSIQSDTRLGSRDVPDINPIVVERGHLTLEECDVSSDAGSGVLARGRETVVEMVRCTVSSTRSAGAAAVDGASLVLEHVRVEGSLRGVVARGRGTSLSVRDSEIDASQEEAAYTDQGATVELLRSRITRSGKVGASASGVGTALRMRGVRVTQSRYSGVSVESGAAAELVDSEVVENGGTGLQVKDPGSSCVGQRVTSRGNQGAGGSAESGGRLELADCLTTENGGSGLTARGPRSTLSLRNVEVLNNQSYGLWIRDGALADSHHALVADNAHSGVRVDGPGTRGVFRHGEIRRNHGPAAIQVKDGASADVANMSASGDTGACVLAEGFGSRLRIDGCDLLATETVIRTSDVDEFVVNASKLRGTSDYYLIQVEGKRTTGSIENNEYDPPEDAIDVDVESSVTVA